jgi:predicted MFS family arabinose efflux permease
MVEDPNDLPNAIAMNSTLFNGARLIGPSLAGMLIASAGEGACFLVDGISYLAVIASLLAMRVAPRPRRGGHAPLVRGIVDGFRYAFGFPPIRAILLFLALVSLLGMPYTVLLPAFARDILGGGPHLLGFLSAMVGIGAMAGALFLASRRSVLGLGRVIAFAGALFGSSLIAFSISRIPWLSMAFILFTGFGMMVQMASSNTVLQTIVEDDKRGRVMSLYTMAFLGMAPFGSLFAGLVASTIGAPATVLVGGVACIAGAALFARELPKLRRVVRPIYVRMGILPEGAGKLPAPPRTGS